MDKLQIEGCTSLKGMKRRAASAYLRLPEKASPTKLRLSNRSFFKSKRRERALEATEQSVKVIVGGAWLLFGMSRSCEVPASRERR